MLRYKLTLLVIICAAFVTIAALAAPRSISIRIGTGRATGDGATYGDGTTPMTYGDGTTQIEYGA